MHSLRGWFFALAAVVIMAGCGGQDRQAEQAAPAGTPELSAPPAATTPDGSTPAWVTQVREGEAKLAAAVEQGRLGEVHDQALQLQGVLKQVSDQAGNLPADQQKQLGEHLAGASRLVDELHDAADASDLTKTKSKLEEFRGHLRAIEGMFGVSAP